MQASCTTCPRPVPDTAYGCTTCATDLTGKLRQLGSVLHELDTTVTRQDRLGAGGVRAVGAEIPLPFNAHAAELRDTVHAELNRWAVFVSRLGRNSVPADGFPPGSALLLLADLASRFRYEMFWSVMHAALSPLLGAVLRAVDRPAERTYLGPCGVKGEDGAPCPADVYARSGAASGTCRVCGTAHGAAESLTWMREQLDDMLARPTEIVGLLRRFDEKLSYSVITKYIRQGRLIPHGRDAEGRDLFRVGDVVALKRASVQVVA